jgi:hypothetical protein
MKPSKLSPTAPSDSTSSQMVEKPNSLPTYDPREDPDDIATQALLRMFKRRRKKQEAEKK